MAGTGTGVALFEYDNDGLLDIFLVNADHIRPLSPPPTVHLYHNLGTAVRGCDGEGRIGAHGMGAGSVRGGL